MSSTVVEPVKESTAVVTTEANSAEVSAPEVQPPHKPQNGIGDHPLWQEYLAELEANRQADIAEANRQAELELEKANPLARIADSYATDPNWAEFPQAMEASRRELDETAD